MDTFVVRLWTPAPTAGDPAAARIGLHGTVHHVGSGRTATFRDGEELTELLSSLGRGVAHAAAEEPAVRNSDVLPTGSRSTTSAPWGSNE
jgi:hypothetical protein